MLIKCFVVIKGGMVTDFSGTLILSNAFVVIGRAITDNLGVLFGLRAKCGPCGHRCKKWLKNQNLNGMI